MQPKSFSEDEGFTDLARADQVFAHALALEGGDRWRYVAEACDGDEELQRQVEGLIRSALETHSLLRPGGAAGGGLLEDFDQQVLEEGAILGDRYRIIHQLGEGGMGVVYLAERADGQFQQQVALKVIRGGASRQTAERFLLERQILAGLSHKNIARLLDGGVSATGQPYLVMEHVDGEPIDSYCQNQDLDLDQRLRLLCDVCDAVQAAHRQLIVHRDLKPSNILVTAQGEVKLLDFGIAKLLESGEGSDPTVGLAMTPQYASPEQYRGENITILSDVYQLGLVAYEVLSGARPYDVSTATPQDAARWICERDPSRPSAMARSQSRFPADVDFGEETQGGTDLGNSSGSVSFAPRLKGDLDAVVLKALAKEPDRRYSSVDRLREDFESYLGGHPVLARPTSFGYRFGKLLRRNRVASAVTALSLCVLFIFSLVFALGLTRERDRTAEEARQSAEVVSFLVDLFKISDPRSGSAGDLTARKILEQGITQIDQDLVDQPLARAKLLVALGEIYKNLGDYQQAKDLLSESLQLREGHAGAGALGISESLMGLGVAESYLGQLETGYTYFQRALALRLQELPSGHISIAESLRQTGASLEYLGRWPESLERCSEALELAEAAGAWGEELALYQAAVAGPLRRLGRFGEASERYREALESVEEEHGKNHFLYGSYMGNLGNVYFSAGDFEKAALHYLQALALQERLVGPIHSDIAISLGSVGLAYSEVGRFEEAREMLQRSASMEAEIFGPSHRRYGATLSSLAALELETNHPDRALEQLTQALGIQEQALGPDHPELASTTHTLGLALEALDRVDEAMSFFERSLDIMEKKYKADHPHFAWPLVSLGRIHMQRGDLKVAEEFLSRAVEVREGAEAVSETEREQARDAYRELQELKAREL